MAASSTGSPCRCASASTARRPEPTSVTSQPWPKSRISVLVYSRATVASVPSTDTSRVRDIAQAGLMAGTVPTNCSEKRRRNSSSTMVEAVLHAITTRFGSNRSVNSPITSTTRPAKSFSIQPP